ncbi:hypothetical protein NPIL_474871 [Nephila pilipes]|uniref:Uncharacterized protein n=1 Tax=Nephila pilipes TaxID=299642 RepID=A0A8X6MZP0_NEPPI|nr:hypothetical protein NPIL_474871 [Nephila pilipes]
MTNPAIVVTICLDPSIRKRDGMIVPYLSPKIGWSSIVLESLMPPEISWNILQQAGTDVFCLNNDGERFAAGKRSVADAHVNLQMPKHAFCEYFASSRVKVHSSEKGTIGMNLGVLLYLQGSAVEV